jgi:8-oxo-dGTP pyrophosphatase MutT (NUDIX family)
MHIADIDKKLLCETANKFKLNLLGSHVDKGSYIFVRFPDFKYLLVRLKKKHYNELLELSLIKKVESVEACNLFSVNKINKILEKLNTCGFIPGWRNENFSCWGDRSDLWPYQDSPYFDCERAGFRYFGIRSHAIHVIGVDGKGGVWIAKRAKSKSVDPGLFDNIAAGGIASKEGALYAAQRELYEEAGLNNSNIRYIKDFLVDIPVVDGWLSERSFLFVTLVDLDTIPKNNDGEVEAFSKVSMNDALEMIKDGLFTNSASSALLAYFNDILRD